MKRSTPRMIEITPGNNNDSNQKDIAIMNRRLDQQIAKYDQQWQRNQEAQEDRLTPEQRRFVWMGILMSVLLILSRPAVKIAEQEFGFSVPWWGFVGFIVWCLLAFVALSSMILKGK